MVRMVPVLAALAALGLALILLPGPAQAVPQNTLTVQVLNAQFTPADGQVLKGGSVTWADQGSVQPHNITADNGAFAFDLLVGQSKTLTFPTPGTITYRCNTHLNTGTLVVDTAPDITMTTPAPNTHATGIILASGTATDADNDIASVTLTLDGQTVGVAGTNDWSADVDLGNEHGKQRTLLARVTDIHGASDTASRGVLVNTPPQVAFAVAPSAPTSADVVAFTPTIVDDHTTNTPTWDFGDGTTATAANTTHRFAKGTHVVRLTAVDDHNAEANTTRTITVLNSAPRANFSLDPADPVKNEAVAFTDRSDDFDGDATTWAWDFGDGGTSAARNATHTYTAPGTYTVKLNVTDAEGATNVFQRVVEVSEFDTQRPIARLSANKARGEAPLAVRFTLGGSDPDGSINNWTLDYGDGSPKVSGTGVLFANGATHPQDHTYERNGTFEAVLSVRDNLGATGTNRTTIIVDPPPNRPPQVKFEVAPTSTPRKGQTLTFADGSTDLDFEDAVVSWDWNFGDGGRSCCDKPRVTHTYTKVGRFVATLTAGDTLGDKATLPVVLEVFGEAPRVLLAVNATQGRAPYPVSFNLDARDTDGRIERWALDFGDGTPPQEGEGPPTNATLRHVYEGAGTFSAQLDAFDDDGLSGRSVVTVTVAARIPEPLPLPPDAISATPTGTRFTYRFAATSAVPGAATYQWAFGDGRTGTGREVEYSYEQTGTYTVTLSILRADGAPAARGTATVGVGEDATIVRERLRSEVASGVVRLLWTPDPRAAGYQVWKAGADGRFEDVALITGASHYDDLEVQDGQAYTYQVTFYSADGSGRLTRLSQLGPTDAFRRLGQVTVEGLVDGDGDGVGDTRDAFPQDSTRSVAPGNPWLLPGLGVVLLLGLGAAAWKYREPLRARFATGPEPGTLASIPGVEPQHAFILQKAGVANVRALAVADPADLARRTVLPRHVLDHWVAVAQLLQLPNIAPQEADLLARAGIRGPWDLARADPAALSQRMQGVAPARAQRWVRTARRATSAS